MALVLNGSGITSANIADGTIVNADINSSAAIDGTKVSGSFGKVLQVVQAVKTDTWSAASGSWVVCPGLTATITRTSTTSKLLVSTSINVGCSYFEVAGRLMRDGTAIGLGNLNGTRAQAMWAGNVYSAASSENTYDWFHMDMNYLDSPSSASAIEYKVAFQSYATNGQNVYVNRTDYNGNGNRYPASTISTITVMEVEV